MKRLVTLLLSLALVLSLCTFAIAESETEVKTYSLMARVSATQGNWDNYWFFEYIEEKLGIAFDITQVSEESFEEKKNLAFATNTLPDLFTGGLSDADIAMYGAQGIIVPLEDYINEEYTPVIKAWFDIIDGYEAALYYPDGHIYNMQGFMIVPRELPTQRYWINNEWATKAIGKLPETIDEYYEYLKYVKENDMNGDGDASNEIPLGGKYKTINTVNASYYDAIRPTIFAFGITERQFEAFDGVVQYNPASAQWKEFLAFMNKCYAEGLLDNEYFTQTDDQYKAKLAQGVVGAFNDWASWLNIPEDEIWMQYTSNTPMTSESFTEKRWGARDLQLVRQFVITNQCEDPQDLMRLANFTMTDDFDGPDAYLSDERTELVGDYKDLLILDESGRLSQWRGAKLGTWDAHPDWGWSWKELEDEFGKYWAVDMDYPKDEYPTMNNFLETIMSPNVFPIPNQRLERQTTVKEDTLTSQVAEYNTPYAYVGWSDNIKLTAEEADEVAMLQVDIEAYVDQMYGKFIVGEADLEAEYDAYVEGLKARGLDRYVEIYQTAYDRWAAMQ